MPQIFNVSFRIIFVSFSVWHVIIALNGHSETVLLKLLNGNPVSIFCLIDRGVCLTKKDEDGCAALLNATYHDYIVTASHLVRV